jgi:hypothetical protein
MLKLNLNISEEVKKSKGNSLVNRTSKFKDVTIVQLGSTRNQCKLPAGKSQELLEVDENSILVIIANYIDPNLTAADVEEADSNLYKELIEAGNILTGQQIVNNIVDGKLLTTLSQEDKENTILDLAEKLSSDVEYALLNLIGKNDIKYEITEDEYNELSEEDKALYYRTTFGDNRIVAVGKISETDSFTTSAWRDLGGTEDSYYDEECTKVVPKSKQGVQERDKDGNEIKKYTKRVLYNIYPEPIVVNNGKKEQKMFILTTKEDDIQISRKRDRKEKEVKED